MIDKYPPSGPSKTAPPIKTHRSPRGLGQSNRIHGAQGAAFLPTARAPGRSFPLNLLLYRINGTVPKPNLNGCLRYAPCFATAGTYTHTHTHKTKTRSNCNNTFGNKKRERGEKRREKRESEREKHAAGPDNGGLVGDRLRIEHANDPFPQPQRNRELFAGRDAVFPYHTSTRLAGLDTLVQQTRALQKFNDMCTITTRDNRVGKAAFVVDPPAHPFFLSFSAQDLACGPTAAVGSQKKKSKGREAACAHTVL